MTAFALQAGQRTVQGSAEAVSRLKPSKQAAEGSLQGAPEPPLPDLPGDVPHVQSLGCVLQRSDRSWCMRAPEIRFAERRHALAQFAGKQADVREWDV